MPVIVGVALGGALGASARYGLDRLIERSSSAVFPWSTFASSVGEGVPRCELPSPNYNLRAFKRLGDAADCR